MPPAVPVRQRHERDQIETTRDPRLHLSLLALSLALELAECALDFRAPRADLLQRRLNFCRRRAGLLRLVFHFVSLPARDALTILTAPPGRLPFRCRHGRS